MIDQSRFSGFLEKAGLSPSPARAREVERIRQMSALVDDLARADFQERYPDPSLAPVTVVIPAYLEAGNLGDVLAAMPEKACGLDIHTLVSVDGGDDGTDQVALEHGAYLLKLPVNRGQGVALRLGYEMALKHGARYVVTLDADGQNDPAEIPNLLQPVVDDEADFVIASRRLGTDTSFDLVRKTGVVLFGEIVNRLTGLSLTDTSNGFRAMSAKVLAEVTLEQDQYQTAELIISAAKRGFRIAERPTLWKRRASGHSKKGNNLVFGFNYGRVILSTWLRERRA